MPTPPGSHCILLIDDSHEDLFLIKRLLSRAGVKHPIVTIDGSEEAVVFLRACLAPGGERLQPAAIFCDVKMPQQSGLELLTWLRGHPPLRAIPFFILSGGNLDEDRTSALALGATDYLVKFPAPAELGKLLARAGLL